MKIALLTIWHEQNYGAELQAYATVKMLQSLGHDVRMIDIRLNDAKKINYKENIIEFLSSLGPCGRKFHRFWKKYIPTTRRYNTISELQANPPIADTYLVGSDQVWNPDITKKFALLYFINFGSANIKRISYASSFGIEKWTHEDLYDRVNSLLHGFSHISCRESSGVRLLQEKFNVNSEHVLDPSLLFDSYPELTGPIKESNTLVYYPLSEDSELEEYSANLASRLGLKPINNNKTKVLFKRVTWDRVGVEEWVKNIAQARFVITRSFHGLAFSLIYKRQFAVLASRNGRGDRLVSLLEKVGLSDRMYDNVEKLNEDKPWGKIIDFKKIDRILNMERERSIKYLLNSLK